MPFNVEPIKENNYSNVVKVLLTLKKEIATNFSKLNINVFGAIDFLIKLNELLKVR